MENPVQIQELKSCPDTCRWVSSPGTSKPSILGIFDQPSQQLCPLEGINASLTSTGGSKYDEPGLTQPPKVISAVKSHNGLLETQSSTSQDNADDISCQSGSKYSCPRSISCVEDTDLDYGKVKDSHIGNNGIASTLTADLDDSSLVHASREDFSSSLSKLVNDTTAPPAPSSTYSIYGHQGSLVNGDESQVCDKSQRANKRRKLQSGGEYAAANASSRSISSSSMPAVNLLYSSHKMNTKNNDKVVFSINNRRSDNENRSLGYEDSVSYFSEDSEKARRSDPYTSNTQNMNEDDPGKAKDVIDRRLPSHVHIFQPAQLAVAARISNEGEVPLAQTRLHRAKDDEEVYIVDRHHFEKAAMSRKTRIKTNIMSAHAGDTVQRKDVLQIPADLVKRSALVEHKSTVAGDVVNGLKPKETEMMSLDSLQATNRGGSTKHFPPTEPTPSSTKKGRSRLAHPSSIKDMSNSSLREQSFLFKLASLFADPQDQSAIITAVHEVSTKANLEKLPEELQTLFDQLTDRFKFDKTFQTFVLSYVVQHIRNGELLDDSFAGSRNGQAYQQVTQAGYLRTWPLEMLRAKYSRLEAQYITSENKRLQAITEKTLYKKIANKIPLAKFDPSATRLPGPGDWICHWTSKDGEICGNISPQYPQVARLDAHPPRRTHFCGLCGSAKDGHILLFPETMANHQGAVVTFAGIKKSASGEKRVLMRYMTPPQQPGTPFSLPYAVYVPDPTALYPDVDIEETDIGLEADGSSVFALAPSVDDDNQQTSIDPIGSARQSMPPPPKPHARLRHRKGNVTSKPQDKSITNNPKPLDESTMNVLVPMSTEPAMGSMDKNNVCTPQSPGGYMSPYTFQPTLPQDQTTGTALSYTPDNNSLGSTYSLPNGFATGFDGNAAPGNFGSGYNMPGSYGLGLQSLELSYGGSPNPMASNNLSGIDLGSSIEYSPLSTFGNNPAISGQGNGFEGRFENGSCYNTTSESLGLMSLMSSNGINVASQNDMMGGAASNFTSNSIPNNDNSMQSYADAYAPPGLETSSIEDLFGPSGLGYDLHNYFQSSPVSSNPNTFSFNASASPMGLHASPVTDLSNQMRSSDMFHNQAQNSQPTSTPVYAVDVVELPYSTTTPSMSDFSGPITPRANTDNSIQLSEEIAENSVTRAGSHTSVTSKPRKAKSTPVLLNLDMSARDSTPENDSSPKKKQRTVVGKKVSMPALNISFSSDEEDNYTTTNLLKAPPAALLKRKSAKMLKSDGGVVARTNQALTAATGVRLKDWQIQSFEPQDRSVASSAGGGTLEITPKKMKKETGPAKGKASAAKAKSAAPTKVKAPPKKKGPAKGWKIARAAAEAEAIAKAEAEAAAAATTGVGSFSSETVTISDDLGSDDEVDMIRTGGDEVAMASMDETAPAGAKTAIDIAEQQQDDVLEEELLAEMEKLEAAERENELKKALFDLDPDEQINSSVYEDQEAGNESESEVSEEE